jgi:Fic family protein
MDVLVEWLRGNRTSPLIRSALLHLNLIAIHPFNDGNGRTSRILSAVELIRDGVSAPELISIEAYLRRNREDYVDMLRTTLGPTYDPDNHPVTEWIDYYTRISLDRLEVRTRILEAMPTDIGMLFAELEDRGQPVEWAPALLAARVSRLRTTQVAALTNRSVAAARAELARMSGAGWLEARGRTRGRWYAPSERLIAVPLRIPSLMRLMARGEALATFDHVPAGPA